MRAQGMGLDEGIGRQDPHGDGLGTLGRVEQSGRVVSGKCAALQSPEKSGLTDPPAKWCASYATRANWFAPSAADQWTSATISSRSLETNEHSDYREMKVDGQASWGMWSGGGGFSKSDSHEHMDETTDDLEVSFKYAKVDISRPWLNALLFSVQGWHTTAAKKYGYSSGKKDQTDTIFPLLPVAFVAVRNVNITAKWGKKDSDLIQSKLDTHANFGWGPFSISGSYASGSTDKHSKSAFDGRTIASNGLQILAWINSVVPACPPEDWPAK